MAEQTEQKRELCCYVGVSTMCMYVASTCCPSICLSLCFTDFFLFQIVQTMSGITKPPIQLIPRAHLRDTDQEVKPFTLYCIESRWSVPAWYGMCLFVCVYVNSLNETFSEINSKMSVFLYLRQLAENHTEDLFNHEWVWTHYADSWTLGDGCLWFTIDYK